MDTFFEAKTYPNPQQRVKVVRLQSTKGFNIRPSALEARELGITGVALGFVAGHGGDVWWVQHDYTSDVTAYGVDELAPVADESEVKS